MRWGICAIVLVGVICLPVLASGQVVIPPSLSAPVVNNPPDLAGQANSIGVFFDPGQEPSFFGNICAFAINSDPSTCWATVVFTGDLGNVSGVTSGCQIGGIGASLLTTFSTPGAYTITATAYQCVSLGKVQTTTVLATATATIQVTALPPPAIVDPVPVLMSGPATATDPNQLIAGGRPVQGVAADGVTQVIIEAPAKNAGDFVTVTLLNDQQSQSNSPAQDGALGATGGTSFTRSEVPFTAISVTAANGQQLPYVFAVYRAPVDFARQNTDGSFMSGTCNGVTNTDDQLACRSVSIQIQDITAQLTTTVPITIVRPPLIMIHGLWDSWHAWDNFSPLVSGVGTVDPRFSIGRVKYDNPVNIVSSDPPYTSAQLQTASSNSLGFQFNAPNVLGQILGWIENFNAGSNPAGIPVADTQVDIVAHSMGGDIARQLVLQPNFLDDDTYGQGSIHKVITIDTPHLGSPLANLLLSPIEDGGCVEYELSLGEDFVFNTAAVGSSGIFDGAMADLAVSSPALETIANQSPHPLPTALFAGVYTNWNSLNVPSFIGGTCDRLGDPLALDLSPTVWPEIFDNQPNDAIVSESSELDGLGPDAGFVFTGVVHSGGTAGYLKGLGFSGPSVLDSDSQTAIPSTVILLLNTSVNSGPFHPLNP